MKNMSIKNICRKLLPEWFIFSHAYHSIRGKWPNLIYPKDLSEIWIQKYLLGYFHKNYFLADKFKVREYIQSKGCGDILVPLLGSWENVEDICFEKLPQQFALKLNYGAGMNIICTDKNVLDLSKVKAKLNEWLNGPKSSNFESHYNLIQRKVICEAFISDEKGVFPYDYKFICLHGKPVCILACTSRETGTTQDAVFTLDWKPLHQFRKSHSPQIEKPQNLDKMIKYAERLSEGLDLVRVDLYDAGNRIFFGEMTLSPAGCMFHAWTQKALDELGRIYRNPQLKL